MKTLIQVLNAAMIALTNCQKAKNAEWAERWMKVIDDIQILKLPSGSGFDAGTKINFERSGPERIVFDVEYHLMDEHGSYDGWTNHSVIAYPTFDGFKLRITGRNRNNIKDYIHDVFSNVLSELYVAKP